MDQIVTATPQGKLASALAKAQGAFPVIPKDKEVQVKSKEGKFLYSYMYAELTTIIACTRPAMSSNGLSFTQGMVEGGFATQIMHDSGEILVTGFIPFDFPKHADMKTVAGLVTYVKRISLTAALGVSADEDVDAAHDQGNEGKTTDKKDLKPVERPTNEVEKREVAQPEPRKATRDQVVLIYAKANACGWKREDVHSAIFKKWNISSANDIPADGVNLLLEYIQSNPMLVRP